MSNYSKVQFISWEIYTGPSVQANKPDGIDGAYAGLYNPAATDHRTDVLGQIRDIEARLAFTADAISKAEAVSDPDPNTLKVFMAPEFLYRGTAGAYLHDLLNGWRSDAPPDFRLGTQFKAWEGLFGGLNKIAADKKYEHWVFVFGTAISAVFPTLEQATKYLLDPSKSAVIYNCALVQRGGDHGDAYAARKHYMATKDFVTWHRGRALHKMSSVEASDPDSLIPRDMLGELEGGAVFQLPTVCDASGKAITFGLEICLDHRASSGRADTGRLRAANQLVKLQLVPSGGMQLMPQSISLQPSSGKTRCAYAFNCDGLSTLNRAYGSHTQVWDGACGSDQGARRLVEANGGAPIPNTRVIAVSTQLVVPAVGLVDAGGLWNSNQGTQGSGHVRVTQAFAL